MGPAAWASHSLRAEGPAGEQLWVQRLTGITGLKHVGAGRRRWRACDRGTPSWSLKYMDLGRQQG